MFKNNYNLDLKVKTKYGLILLMFSKGFPIYNIKEVC